MATVQPMHPGRILDVFAHLLDETGRRLQDIANRTGHVLVHGRFVLGSMETDDKLVRLRSYIGPTDAFGFSNHTTTS